MVMLNNAFAESAITDMKTIVPLMYLGILITMVLLVRSFTGTFGALFVILLSSATVSKPGQRRCDGGNVRLGLQRILPPGVAGCPPVLCGIDIEA
jgi:hypothetical protein